MKSLSELAALRDKMKKAVAMRENQSDIRVAVGMATCGIAAGARPLLNAFVEAVDKADLGEKVVVTQTGCIGLCEQEPVVEVFEKGKDKVTYVKVTPDMVAEIVEKHLKNGQVVEKYTAGAMK
ncbi:MAG: (2Fe-2S) ferredoxin domain-containing protein [Clostridia bacterium]|nr:(2Fe-2S) ferredoxin domain-containing protein [Clostridia bacterium]